MNPAHDPLYRIHGWQATRRGQCTMPYETFRARVPTTHETDLTGLLMPPAGLTIEIHMKCGSKFQLGTVCITANAATAVPPEKVSQAVARHAAGDWDALDANIGFAVDEHEQRFKAAELIRRTTQNGHEPSGLIAKLRGIADWSFVLTAVRLLQSVRDLFSVLSHPHR